METLNSHALEIIDRYLNLQIDGVTLTAPYFSNDSFNEFKKLMRDVDMPEEYYKRVNEMYKNKEALYGWYRGKGTPEEIIQATIELIRKFDLNTKNATPQGLSEFMKFNGIGIDCSGLVYHVLDYVFNKIGKQRDYVESLNWANDENKDVYHAGTLVFGGSASAEVNPTDIQPLDIILIGEHCLLFCPPRAVLIEFLWNIRFSFLRRSTVNLLLRNPLCFE